MTRPEPPVRDDGRCAGPSCRKRLPRDVRAGHYGKEALALDPFCSTECCRAYHRTSLKKTEQVRKRKFQP